MRHNRRVDDILSYDESLLDGRVFVADMDLSIEASAPVTISIEPHDIPLIIFSWELRSGSDKFSVKIFEGGTFSGGEDVVISGRNLSVPSITLIFNSMRKEVTIDTPGVLIYKPPSESEEIRAGTRGTSKFITPRDKNLYFTVSNDGGGTKDATMSIILGPYPKELIDLLS